MDNTRNDKQQRQQRLQQIVKARQQRQLYSKNNNNNNDNKICQRKSIAMSPHAEKLHCLSHVECKSFAYYGYLWRIVDVHEKGYWFLQKNGRLLYFLEFDHAVGETSFEPRKEGHVMAIVLAANDISVVTILVYENINQVKKRARGAKIHDQ